MISKIVNPTAFRPPSWVQGQWTRQFRPVPRPLGFSRTFLQSLRLLRLLVLCSGACSGVDAQLPALALEMLSTPEAQAPFRLPQLACSTCPPCSQSVVAFPGPVPAWTQTRLSDPISFQSGWQLWSQVVFENGVCLTWERVPKPDTGTQGNSDPVLLILKLLGFRKALMLKIKTMALR